MKATKLASGFAVTALAAAVSMSAMAIDVNGDEQADGSAGFGGSVGFNTTIDLDSTSNERKNSASSAGNVQWNLSDDVFDINLGLSHNDDGDTQFTVGNAVYDDRTFRFGTNIGSIIGSEGTGIAGSSDMSFGAGAGFRYYDNTKAFGVKGLRFVAQLEENSSATVTAVAEVAAVTTAVDAVDEVTTTFTGSGGGTIDHVTTEAADAIAVSDKVDAVDAVEGTTFGIAATATYRKPGSQTTIITSVQYSELTGRSLVANDDGDFDLVENNAADPFVGVRVNSTVNRSINYVAAVNFRTVVDAAARVNWTDNGSKNVMGAFGSVALHDADTTIQAGATYMLEITEDISWTNFGATVTIPLDGDIVVEANVRQDQGFFYGSSAVKATLADDTLLEVKSEVGTKSTSGYTAKAFFNLNEDETTEFGGEATYDVEAFTFNASYTMRGDETTELKAGVSTELKGGANLSLNYENDDKAGDDLANKIVFAAGYSF
ncbi:MAG: hypothetical protein HRU38_24160 [Saccharospirillaceae bacterium]|nr:hypothetical protein [Pseudomonadales bacterium]NRB81717.1 hypothetical protein [Saccharospirillaceae bacterium]